MRRVEKAAALACLRIGDGDGREGNRVRKASMIGVLGTSILVRGQGWYVHDVVSGLCLYGWGGRRGRDVDLGMHVLSS